MQLEGDGQDGAKSEEGEEKLQAPEFPAVAEHHGSVADVFILVSCLIEGKRVWWRRNQLLNKGFRR